MPAIVGLTSMSGVMPMRCVGRLLGYWVNDQRGDPLFVVTAEANAAMVKMLPVVLRQVRNLIGQRRVPIVFDRGG
jgi:hypothetical protein